MPLLLSNRSRYGSYFRRPALEISTLSPLTVWIFAVLWLRRKRGTGKRTVSRFSSQPLYGKTGSAGVLAAGVFLRWLCPHTPDLIQRTGGRVSVPVAASFWGIAWARRFPVPAVSGFPVPSLSVPGAAVPVPYSLLSCPLSPASGYGRFPAPSPLR